MIENAHCEFADGQWRLVMLGNAFPPKKHILLNDLHSDVIFVGNLYFFCVDSLFIVRNPRILCARGQS